MTPYDGAAPDGVVTVAAPAKVNLTLHVVGRRDDGYHLLDSLVAFADVGDLLTFRAADDLTLTVDGPFADQVRDLGEANLVLRAARALAAKAGIVPKAAIHLTKGLPVASGIGGGSADAAATLIGLMELWQLELLPSDLIELGLALGADVPVCLRGRATLVGGIGDVLNPAPNLPPCWLLLVRPGVPLSTPAVFKARDGEFSSAYPLTKRPADVQELVGALKIRRNDLTDAALSLAPVVGEALAAIEAAPGCLLSRMSGSGATCFGLFADEAEARAAADSIASAHPDWWVVPASLIS